MANVIINKGLSAFNQDSFSLNQDKLSLTPPPKPYVKQQAKFIQANTSLLFDPVYNQINNQIAYDNLVLSQKESYENSKFTPNLKYNGANTLSFSGLGLKNNYKNQVSPGFEALKKQSVSDYSMAKSDSSSSPPSSPRNNSASSISSARSIKNESIIGMSVNPNDTDYLQELDFPRTTNIQYNNSSHFFASSIILNNPPKSRSYSAPSKNTNSSPKSPAYSISSSSMNSYVNSPVNAPVNAPVNMVPQYNRNTIIENPIGKKSYTSDRTNMIPPTKKKQIGESFILNKQTSMTNGYSSASDNNNKITYTTPAIDAVLNSKKNSFMEAFTEKPKTNRRGKNIIDYTISSASSAPGDSSSGSNFSDKVITLKKKK